MIKAIVRRVLPVRSAARKIYHLTRARAEMVSLRRAYRRRYGRGFVYTIDKRDEMYGFLRCHGATDLVVPIPDPCYARRAYLATGEMMLGDLEEVLRDLGRSLGGLRSFLDFACGYGRLARFLVHRLDRHRITVSDINKAAVDFAAGTFGVNGFYSTWDASELVHDGTYEVIFVASLFSHLTYSHWGAWLKRLYRMLDEGGLLIFSTHGPHVFRLLGDGARRGVETPMEGFSFRKENETLGRLSTDYYANTFVTEGYVRGFVAANSLGTVVGCYPVKLWHFQDVYVLERTST